MDLSERVRHLAGTRGDLSSVRSGLDEALRASVGYDIAAISTVDPATMLWTSCFVSGLPRGGEAEREQVIYDLEFSGDDLNSYTELANSGKLVARLHATTGGDLGRAKRWERLLAGLGIVDEMRVVLPSREQVWGTLTLYRRHPRSPFSQRDEAVVVGAVGAMADLFRLAMLRAAIDAPGGIDRPPGVLTVSRTGDVTAVSAAAQAWLEAIDDRDRIPSVVRSVAAAAVAGDGLAHAAFPAPEGQWVMLHAAPLADAISIIIEGARPATLSRVIADAYAFTPREQDVTAAVARGRSNKQIALGLGISPFTVQDHLKAVFTKVGVQSRGELVAALYSQHYAPRREVGATPSPYGWYLDDNAARAS